MNPGVVTNLSKVEQKLWSLALFQGLSWYPLRSLLYTEIGGRPKSLLFNLWQ